MRNRFAEKTWGIDRLGRPAGDLDDNSEGGVGFSTEFTPPGRERDEGIGISSLVPERTDDGHAPSHPLKAFALLQSAIDGDCHPLRH